MDTEPIHNENKLLYEAMEIALRLEALCKVLNIDSYGLDSTLSTVKTRINANLKDI